MIDTKKDDNENVQEYQDDSANPKTNMSSSSLGKVLGKASNADESKKKRIKDLLSKAKNLTSPY